MKNKLKSYSFWMSVSAGVVLVLNNIGKVFGFVVESETVTQIVDSVCGVLILFGVLTMPKNQNEQCSKDDNIENNQTKDIENNNIETLKDSSMKNDEITTQHETKKINKKRTKQQKTICQTDADKEQGE